MPRLFLRIFLSYWLALILTLVASTLLLPRPGESNVAFVWAVATRLAIAIGISGIVCLLAAHYVTRPVMAIRSAARSLAEGNLSVRAVVHLSHEKPTKQDEIEGLVHDFNRMAGRLESLVESQKRFVRDASHELCSPLARLSLALDLLRQSPEEMNEHAATMEKEIERLNLIIGRLLMLMRLEGEAEVLAREWLDLEDLTLQIVDDVKLEWTARRCTVRTVCPDSCPVYGDIELLRSAIENVLLNAIRHTQVESEVSLQLFRDKDHGLARIVIEDSGPGIPDSELPKIFQPFYRVDPSRSRPTGGFGLGLAIAQRAIQLHGGTIRARNRTDNHGLHVEVEVPTRELQPDTAETSATPT